MSAEILREAADKMRERAEAATPGGPRWETEPVEVMPSHRFILPADSDSAIASAPVDDAEHIASWHPDVALAVADWLEHEARLEDECQRQGAILPPAARRARSLAVARAYLGSDS